MAVVTVTVSFDEVYAAAQHEGIDFVHPRGGKAKYLEDQYKANLPRYEAALAAVVKRRTAEREPETGDEILFVQLQAAVEWARQVGEHLAGASQRDAPIELGALRASVHVDVDVDA